MGCGAAVTITGSISSGSPTPGPRNFLSVKVFRRDLEADFKRLFVIGFVC
jgi:hypothetical protein